MPQKGSESLETFNSLRIILLGFSGNVREMFGPFSEIPNVLVDIEVIELPDKTVL